MYNDRRKKIIRISLIVVGIIIIVIAYLFIKNKQQTQQTTNTKGNFFLDLGSLITGKRQGPTGVSLIDNKNDKDQDSSNSSDKNRSSNSGGAFVSAGLPNPTPIAQNIGGGFGTNNGDLFPDGQDPNNCIGCNNINPGDLGLDDSKNQDSTGSDSSYVYVNAVPSAIHKDDEVTVTWDSSNVKSCTATSYPVVSGWSGNIEKTGSKYFSLKKPTTFIVKCTTQSGSVQASDSVSVLADDVPLCEQDNTCFTGDENSGKYVSVVMSASPYIVEAGSASTLTWNTENADMCNANSVPLRDDWKGLVAQHAGETNVTLPNSPVTYILTCTDGKTTGQTDLTISIDTSGLGDPIGPGDEPINLCDKPGQESNPLCLAKDISYEEEERRLILTDAEQATLDSLMKEVAIMSPTLPSNQTSSSLNISTQTYRTILNDTQSNIDTCYNLTQKDQVLIDALWERQIIGRRDGGSLPKTVVDRYQVVKPSRNLLQKYRDIATKRPGYSWTWENFEIDYDNGNRFSEFGNDSTKNADYENLGDKNYKLCPGRRYTSLYKSVAQHGQEWGGEQVEGTFIFPSMLSDCWSMDKWKPELKAEEEDIQNLYNVVPGYGRMQEQVEYGSDSKGIKIY